MSAKDTVCLLASRMTSACLASISNRRRVYVTLHFLSFALLFSPSQISWYFGNLAVYLNSYWYATQNPSRFDSQWVMSVFIITWSATLIVGGKMTGRLDRRIILFLGVLCFGFGVFCSYFSVQHSQIAFIITFGGLTGIGAGFIQTEIFSRIPTLIGKRLGLAFAVVTNFLVFGSAFIQGILTWHTNPRNLKADDLVFGHFNVFSEKSVVDHVPSVFLVLGIAISFLHWTGFLLSVILTDKRMEKHEKDSNTGTKAAESSVMHMEDKQENQMAETKNANPLSHERKTSQLMCSKSDCNESTGSGYFQTIEKPSTPHDYQKLCASDSLSIEKLNVSNTGDLNEKQMLKTVAFYVLWLSFFANEAAVVVLLNYYKTFGELYIYDDHFLTFMGMAFLCVVFVMRIVWAMLIDMCGVKNTQIVLNTLMSLSFLFYYFTPQVHRWLFAVWTCALASLCSAVYVNLPVMTLQLFGKTHFTSNYPILSTSTIFLNVVGPPAFQILIKNIGWAALFISVGAINAVALIAAVMRLPNKK